MSPVRARSPTLASCPLGSSHFLSAAITFEELVASGRIPRAWRDSLTLVSRLSFAQAHQHEGEDRDGGGDDESAAPHAEQDAVVPGEQAQDHHQVEVRDERERE